jgi:hypothetical protein
MTFSIVRFPEEKDEERHNCQPQLPTRGWFTKDRRLCVDGTIIECDICGKKYEWGRWHYTPYVQATWTGWKWINKPIPKPPKGNAPG